jgi:hypothetical protein
MALTKFDRIYLAGLFDGEGCVNVSVFIRGDGRRQMIAALDIGNTNPAVLYWLEENFGGRVAEHGKPGKFDRRQHFYRWQVYTQEARVFAKLILPYSRMKSEQLQKFIELVETMNARGNGRLDDEIWQQRIAIVNEIRNSPFRRVAVNRKG